MNPVRCPACKGNHNLNEHFRLLREAKSSPVVEKVVRKVAPEPGVTPDVINPVINPLSDVINVANGKNAARLKWQKAHREEYNAKMREYRRSHPKAKVV